jgi:hypothetical protein
VETKEKYLRSKNREDIILRRGYEGRKDLGEIAPNLRGRSTPEMTMHDVGHALALDLCSIVDEARHVLEAAKQLSEIISQNRTNQLALKIKLEEMGTSRS